MNLFAAALALAAILLLLKARLNYNSLPELVPRPDDPTGEPDVTIIIPARNEAANIAGAVCGFPSKRVIVVDDASTDDTAKLARDAGATVMQAPPLRRGAFGKANACSAGAKTAGAEWILFVDADTRYTPEFLLAIVNYAREHSLDMASALLDRRCSSFAERLLSPYTLALCFAGVSAKRINSRKSTDALVNGQCLLFRRQAYEFIGGYRPLIKNPAAEAHLAAVAKRHRLKCRTIRAERLGYAILCRGWRDIWSRFGRTGPGFLTASPLARVQMILAALLLASCLPMAAWLFAVKYAWQGATILLLPTVLLIPWYRNRMALLSTAAVYGVPLMALNALISLVIARRIQWKGRRI